MTFVQTGVLTSIIGLLSHANPDISISIINLINELVDAETIASEEESIILIDSLIDNHVLAELVSNLDRLNEEQKEDAQAVYNTLVRHSTQ